MYQRNILIVENLTNLSKLSEVSQYSDNCYLMVGATKHVGGTGGPARVMATCEIDNDEKHEYEHSDDLESN